jgi:CRP-like cAMP-binding protein
MSILSIRKLSFHQGARIAFRGDSYNKLWIIISGYITGEFHDFSGKVLKVETMHAPEAIATAVLFAPENVLPVDLIAASDVEIAEIPKRQVVRLLQQEEQVLTNYLADNGQRLMLLADKLRFVQFSTIRQKIAGFLLDLAARQGIDAPEMHMTKEALAEVFGVTRPSLSRGFQQLCDEGLIRQEGRVIHLLDSDGLGMLLHKKGE